MTLLHRLASILDWIFRRTRAEQRLDDDLQSYIEMSAADKMKDGIAPEEARRLASIEIGGVEQAKERVRTERHGGLVDEIGRDVRYGLRMFARTPGFTSVILLTLALGIGANTAIFSLIDALMLRSLPVRNPQELVLINLRDKAALDIAGESLSYAIVRALDGRRDVFSGVGGFDPVSLDVGEPGSVHRVSSVFVTGGFFETLGVHPAAGRLLTRDDDERGAALAAVISHGYWEREFGRSAAAIGGAIRMNGVPVTIVGVTPPGFDGADVGQIADITMAAAALPQVRPSMAEMVNPGNFWLRALARPAAGISAREAASRLNAAWPALSDSVISPGWSAPRRKAMAESVFVFEPGATGWTYLREIYQRPLLVLMAVAGLVLLIACANVASLFLARASTRRREIAVRLAIGANSGRIIRQLLIEGLTLSCAGAVLGVAVAYASERVLMNLMLTGPFQVIFDLTPNVHVLLFSAGLASLTGVIFGVAPAMQSSRTAPSAALRNDERTSTKRSALLPSLVTLQVALSLVLVAGAGLFVRTLSNLQHVDAGFTADGVFVVDLLRGQEPSPHRLLEVVRHVPGVVTAGVTTHTPLDGSSWSEAIVPAGQPLPERDNARIIGAGPDFLETLAIPLVAGRAFRASDVAGAPAVAVINERYAEQHFPRQNPLGQHLVSSLMGQPGDLQVVGVVRNTVASGLRRQPPPIVYVSFAQFGSKLSPQLAIRATGATAAVAEAVRAALQAQLPSMPVEVRPLSSQIGSTIVQERMVATVATGFGVLALVLSSVGLYGLLAYNVARRSREIGIRMALGATASGVIGAVVLRGIRLVAAGVVLGFPAVWLASRAVASMLFGVKPVDPFTLVGAVVLLASSALVASYVPARRASHIDPLRALNCE